MRQEFTDEILKIKNDKLREVALEMADNAPTYFWTVASSSSGKYHPAISLGEGGLVRHSIMTCRIALDLLDAEIFIANSDDNKDKVILTALYHDVIKRGNGDNNAHTAFEHPLLSSNFVREYLYKADFDEKFIDEVCNAIAHHMGKWTTSNYSKTILIPPQNDFEMLIHTADFMASRKYIGGLEEWIERL